MMHKLSAKISSATPERSEMLTRSLTQNVGLVLAVTPRKQRERERERERMREMKGKVKDHRGKMVTPGPNFG
jgi:hypothetical protein